MGVAAVDELDPFDGEMTVGVLDRVFEVRCEHEHDELVEADGGNVDAAIERLISQQR